MPRPAGRAEVGSFADHAAENLQFIRHTMERSATFSAVPGIGGALMGGVGLLAAIVASQQPTAERWLLAWLGAAVIALVTGVLMMRRKAARVGAPLTGAVGTTVCAQPRGAAHRRRGVDLRIVDSRRMGLDAGRLAAALRHRRPDWRRVQRRADAGAGSDVHGARRGRAPHASFLGECVAGDRVRCVAGRVRDLHRAATWGVARRVRQVRRGTGGCEGLSASAQARRWTVIMEGLAE